MELKIAIVGCGKIAEGHVEEIAKLAGVARVVAVCDREPLMAEAMALRHGVAAWHHDFDRLLVVERPDVVHITTPPQSHLALACAALDAGAHVYVEKPLTPSCQDSRALVEYARRANRKLTIGYSYYFDPLIETLREKLLQGELGEVVHVESFLGYDLAGPFGRVVLADPSHWVHRLPGKLFQNNLDHVLSRVAELLPDPRPDAAVESDPVGPLQITAKGWKRRPGSFGDVRDHMLDELRVTFAGGPMSAFAWFSSHLRPAGQFARVYGTRNTAQVDLGTNTLTLGSQSRLPSALGRLVPAADQSAQYLRGAARNLARFGRGEFHYFSGMNRLFCLFYQSILRDLPPPIPYRDILRVAGWMDEIWRQVPQGAETP